MGRIVGIDYGRARIGLAISDETKKIALPLEIVKCSNDLKNNLNALKKLFEKNRYTIEKFVIGLPLHLSGRESEMSQEVREFAKAVEDFFSLPAVLFDERLSSAAAEVMLKELSISRKKRSHYVDSTAAAIILQSFLDASI